jgi:GDP-D-mannose dehydratase
MNKADGKAIAKKLIQITSKEARYLLRTVARLDAYSVTELYAEWMTVNYCERYDILVRGIFVQP